MSSEQIRKLMRELSHTIPVYDPLIITLNKHQYWIANGGDLECSGSLNIDKDLFEEGEPHQKENYWFYCYVKHLRLKIKHSTIKIN